MVAPNGARLTTSDHPAIPVTPAQVVATVTACEMAGAGAVHLHVRDQNQVHVLDADRYKHSVESLRQVLGPDFPIQITTEAVGRYTQAQQIKLVHDLKPQFVSVALAEMAASEDQLAAAEQFYHWSQAQHIGLQHILYSSDDLERFLALKQRGVVPPDNWSILFVLGRYTPDQQSESSAIGSFLSVLKAEGVEDLARWMICAFGSNETTCLAAAAELGGHVRVGFENNRLNEDGSVARNNEERVQRVVTTLAAQNQIPCGLDQMRKLLGAT